MNRAPHGSGRSRLRGGIEMSHMPWQSHEQERSRIPPLARMLMSSEMSGEPPRSLNMKEKFDRWMVNDGWRRLFVTIFALVHVLLFVVGMLNYSLKDNLSRARGLLGSSYAVARAAALVLHFDVAVILFPVSRTLISLLRQTPLNGVIPFDKSIAFHQITAWSIVFFSLLHTIAHWVNFARIASSEGLGIKGFLQLNFTTGPGWTGYIMLAALVAIALTSLEGPRRANHERFWNTHHLFIIFFLFWSFHGAFCMIKPDLPPFCDGTGVFYLYWIFGGSVYLLERLMREVRGKNRTIITKVIQHPSNVFEIQLRKEKTKMRPGQYIFINCPVVSIWQYHPFTLTSAPEEDYISVHIRCVGNFTKDLAKAVGCDFDEKEQPSYERRNRRESTVIGVDANTSEQDVDPRLRRILPRIFIDGPFGSASEDVFKFEVAVLVGAGIGVTPFASILKSIWYRMSQRQNKTRLKKVYFFWVCRDFGSFEWFSSLLLAIEAQDRYSNIEIHTYLTAKIQSDDATNIMINDADADRDAITGLRAPTNFGRPNWDMVFRSIRKIHAPAEAGVFFCGPKALGSVLHVKCNMYSEPGFNFVWGEENF
ncbi:Superoxide-generating NADPH oxidase heavy chain subunit A [Trichophyton interdigitale]|nr:Superoxide-generating NADPH oxidase heavy chain subunit A [Trichophyton interdigitale]KAG5218463.1 Superoxide-generating NADPH oxidase heavy chain subunit A [Trichophyton interdigitale]